MTTTRPLLVRRLGRIDYARGLEWQHASLEAVRAGGCDRLGLLEHAPVYTLGARARRSGLRVAEADLPAPLVEADRGGDITFHGPGQLVAYPVLDLRARDLRPGDFVRGLEEALLRTLATFGGEAFRWPGRAGIWVHSADGAGAPAKLAAIGVRVREGITQHGLALNVTTDLRWYDPIIPCGLEDATVTSLERLLGDPPSLATVEDALVEAFASVFACAPIEAPDAALTPVREFARA